MNRPLIAVVGACLLALVPSCSRPSENDRTVVLYTSADDYVVREIIGEFEKQTGITVKLVGDTEATKTTGLVTRLLAEKDAPKADVWWSSEPFGTIRLAHEGVLAPYTCEPAEAAFESGWPARLRATDNTWYGFSQRARVIAYSTNRVPTPPTTLAELTKPEWKNRVGMAHPEFGTTRGHMGVLCTSWGPEAFEAWLVAMRDNGLRLYDGNASAVRAVANGEIDVCLTDTDDVFGANRNDWDLDLVFEASDAGTDAWPSFGPMVMPNTVSLVKGAHHPAEAGELIAYLLSGKTERLLAASDSRNYPVLPGVDPNPASPPPEHPAEIDLGAVADHVPAAMAICDRVLN